MLTYDCEQLEYFLQKFSTRFTLFIPVSTNFFLPVTPLKLALLSENKQIILLTPIDLFDFFLVHVVTYLLPWMHNQ